MRTKTMYPENAKDTYRLSTFLLGVACLCGLWSCASVGEPTSAEKRGVEVLTALEKGAAKTDCCAAPTETTGNPADLATAKADCCPAPKDTSGHPAELAAAGADTSGVVTTLSSVSIPDVVLTDQDGRKVRFYTELVKDRVVAMNFIFTTCTTVCPPLTANFASVQRQLGDRVGKDVHMITVSVDPLNDTPPRLKAWGEKFGAKPGWTFLTGSKHDVDTLLKALRVFTPLKEDHSPLVLVGNDAKGEWVRVYGLAAPRKIVEVVDRLAGKSQAPEHEVASARLETTAATQEPAITPGNALAGAGTTTVEAAFQPDHAGPHAAHSHTSQETASADVSGRGDTGNPMARKYFTDVELVNQDGETMRLYSDLIKGKTVIISSFFASCTGVCPVLCSKLKAIQNLVGNRLGKDVHIIAISVDCLNDTPEVLGEYAVRNEAKPGWYFVTGEKENVDFALQKLGLWVPDREQHKNLFLIGNDRTGLWKKAFGLADEGAILEIVKSVLNDTGEDDVGLARKSR